MIPARYGAIRRVAAWGVACALAWASGSASGLAEDGRTVRLTSLEWPPYSGADLPGQGMSVGIVRQALRTAGYALAVDFMPWRRALALGLGADPGYDGVMPEYHARPREARCAFSVPIGYGPLGFAERTGAGFRWRTLSDLTHLRVGVVTDYANTEAFDAMVAAGILKVEAVERDVLNLRRLALGRIDLAVIDAFVFGHLVSGAPELAAALRMNEHLLGENSLHVCFRRTGTGRARAFARILEQALAGVDVRALQDDYPRP